MKARMSAKEKDELLTKLAAEAVKENLVNDSRSRVQANLRLPEGLWRQVRQAAAEDNTSALELVASAVTNYLRARSASRSTRRTKTKTATFSATSRRRYSDSHEPRRSTPQRSSPEWLRRRTRGSPRDGHLQGVPAPETR
jgi:hypothetical protein